MFVYAYVLLMMLFIIIIDYTSLLYSRNGIPVIIIYKFDLLFKLL